MTITSELNKGGRKITAGIFLFILTACVTINIYFPAAKVQKTAEEIVRDVRGQDAEDLQKTPDAEQDPGPVSMFSFTSEAWAGGELTVSNATIRTLKSSIKQNYPLLRRWLIEGVLAENFEGYVVVKDESGLNLKERVGMKRTMNEENSNRKALYEAVAHALNIPSSQIKKVGRIFAQQWQRAVPQGTWIEKEPGKWVKR